MIFHVMCHISIYSCSLTHIIIAANCFFPSPGGAEQWDKAILDANSEYRTRMHNICCDNCHSHVAYALNTMNIRAFGIRNWDMVKLCFLLFFRGKFLSVSGMLAQFLPFAIIVMIVVLVKTIWQYEWFTIWSCREIITIPTLYLVRDKSQWLTNLFSEELLYSGRWFSDRYFSGGMDDETETTILTPFYAAITGGQWMFLQCSSRVACSSIWKFVYHTIDGVLHLDFLHRDLGL